MLGASGSAAGAASAGELGRHHGWRRAVDARIDSSGDTCERQGAERANSLAVHRELLGGLFLHLATIPQGSPSAVAAALVRLRLRPSEDGKGRITVTAHAGLNLIGFDNALSGRFILPADRQLLELYLTARSARLKPTPASTSRPSASRRSPSRSPATGPRSISPTTRSSSSRASSTRSSIRLPTTRRSPTSSVTRSACPIAIFRRATAMISST